MILDPVKAKPWLIPLDSLRGYWAKGGVTPLPWEALPLDGNDPRKEAAAFKASLSQFTIQTILDLEKEQRLEKDSIAAEVIIKKPLQSPPHMIKAFPPKTGNQ